MAESNNTLSNNTLFEKLYKYEKLKQILYDIVENEFVIFGEFVRNFPDSLSAIGDRELPTIVHVTSNNPSQGMKAINDYMSQYGCIKFANSFKYGAFNKWKYVDVVDDLGIHIVTIYYGDKLVEDIVIDVDVNLMCYGKNAVFTDHSAAIYEHIMGKKATLLTDPWDLSKIIINDLVELLKQGWTLFDKHGMEYMIKIANRPYIYTQEEISDFLSNKGVLKTYRVSFVPRKPPTLRL